jgi:hypothetical protein
MKNHDVRVKQPASIADYVPAFWLIMAGLAMRNVADFGAMALFTSHRAATPMSRGSLRKAGNVCQPWTTRTTVNIRR